MLPRPIAAAAPAATKTLAAAPAATKTLAVAFVLFCLAVIPTRASVLTFETTPTGSTPVDNAPLDSPYAIPGGSVRFFFDANGNNAYDSTLDELPAFEQTSDGDTVNGFASTVAGGHDNPRPAVAAQLGQFFLRTPLGKDGGPVPGPFIAAYTTATSIRALSGEIWDIDGGAAGNEQWRVDVLNGSGTVLATQLSPLGTAQGVNSLDGLPWIFQFTDLPDGVTSARLTFLGTKSDGIGLAFNNFSPDTAVPEPTAACLVLLASGLGCRRRRRGSVA